MGRTTQAAQQIFKRGSKTYYFSSIFFPEPYRSAIVTLYAFVRTADDFVDQVLPDEVGFHHFVRLSWKYWNAPTDPAATLVGNERIIADFVTLAKTSGIEEQLVQAFFASMELDLVKSTYETIDETVSYMYGSAEVIGLMIARIFQLPTDAEPTARLLGRAMQYINMIRDVSEDQKLGRQYLPTSELRATGLTELSAQAAARQPAAFRQFILTQLARQADWMLVARQGFCYLPRPLRIPVQTASDMYDWTANEIAQNPAVIWQRSVKPSRWRVMRRAIWLWLTLDRV